MTHRNSIFRTLKKFTGFICKAILVTGGLILFQGCYLMKQGVYLLRYTRSAVDNKLLLSSPETPEPTKVFLEQVADISSFARSELGLADNKNYTRYVDMNQDFLAFVVSGTGRYSFEPYRWPYPLIGKAPYKGFYEKADALKEAEHLRKRGYDVWVRKVDAFSTIGYLTDPLYSYMQDYPPDRIANLLIHEQAHATLFLKGQDDFNEGFATFIGNEGARLYILTRFGLDSPEYISMTDREKDGETFLSALQKLKGNLELLYARRPEDMEKEKQRLLEEFKTDMETNYDTLYRTEAYRGVAGLQVNNAFLSLYSLYNGNSGIFEEIHELCEKDLRRTLQLLQDTVAGSENPLGELQEWIKTKQEKTDTKDSQE